MGIIDENCILMDKYEIIFLGDIMNYEMLILILNLIVINPNKVHYNKGNIYTFNSPQITSRLNEMASYQHSAIVIRNPITNKYIYLSHSGLPIKIISYIKLISETEDSITIKSDYMFKLSNTFITSLKFMKNIFLDKINFTTNNLYIEKFINKKIKFIEPKLYIEDDDNNMEDVISTKLMIKLF
jgi:hypothetical protein